METTRLLTYQHVADAYGLHPATLRTWVHRKQIPHLRLGGRIVRFVPADLHRWIEAQRVETGLPLKNTAQTSNCPSDLNEAPR